MPNSFVILVIFFLLCNNTNFLYRVTSSTSADDCDGPLVFSFPSFNATSCDATGGLLCMGAVVSGGGFLNLTAGPPENSSATAAEMADLNAIAKVLYRKPVSVWPASFAVAFLSGYSHISIQHGLVMAWLLSWLKIIILLPFLALALILVSKIRKLQRERIRRMEDIERRSATTALRKFTYKQLAKATKNFSKDNLLGTGGFGSVYKGNIMDPPQTIAVKKISANSEQGEREYLAEISTIGRLRHKNILQLQGWCHENEHLLLVYDYMPNKSLHQFLTGGGFLDWKKRYKILTGLASALLYLHEECGDPVVHRDVKPSNVMLDADFNPRLGDFGLARLLSNVGGVTTMVAGTLGYMAPEVSYTGRATT